MAMLRIEPAYHSARSRRVSVHPHGYRVPMIVGRASSTAGTVIHVPVALAAASAIDVTVNVIRAEPPQTRPSRWDLMLNRAGAAAGIVSLVIEAARWLVLRVLGRATTAHAAWWPRLG
jgi:hypothetical protein